MIQNVFDAIDKHDIDLLIENNVAEFKTLEYKEILPGGSDSDRKEFLYDVASFANASGGDIVYGLRGAKNNGRSTGWAECAVPLQGVTADQTKLRLEEMIRTGIAPALRVQIKEITGFGKDGADFLILIRIPKSFNGPHMVTFQKSCRFYSRNSAGKYRIEDVGELRSAFLASESQTEKIKSFRNGRLADIVANETPARLTPEPDRAVLHLVPLNNFLSRSVLNLIEIDRVALELSLFGRSVRDYRHNLDGFLLVDMEDDSTGDHDAYCQIFRDGCIESVVCKISHSNKTGHFLPSMQFEGIVLRSVASYLKFYKSLGISPPFVISLSILGCRGVEFATEQLQMLSRNTAFDRDPIILPEVAVPDFETGVDEALKPVFDSLWNCGGYAKCMHYDESGKKFSPNRFAIIN